MKIKHNVTLYKCDFCRATRQRKSAMEKHEENCTSNPKNQTCCSICDHLEETEETYEIQIAVDYFSQHKTRGFYCSKLNKKLYPHKVVRIGLLEKYPEQFEESEQMPRECEYCCINGFDDQILLSNWRD